MLKKKRLAILFSLFLLGWVAWKAGVLAALLCFGAAVVLLLVLKGGHILANRAGMAKLAEVEALRFDNMQCRLPAPPTSRPWHFVVLGDTRNNTTVASKLYEKTRALGPVMAFHTGDIVRGGRASEFMRNHVRLLQEHLDPVPLFCVPGNHERGPLRDYAAFTALYGDDKFAFVYDDCCFVGFNNSSKKGVSEEVLAFLDEHLKPAYGRKFVFTHIPPAFFEAAFAQDARRRGFKRHADAFHDLMVRHRVDEIFFAHIHGYATMLRDGVRYTLTAGGGAPLSKRIVPTDRHYHLIDMEVGPDALKRTVLFLDGERWTARPVSD